MSIEAINATPLSNNASVSATNSNSATTLNNQIVPSDVAAFQSLVSNVAAASAATPEATHTATMADFYRQFQYDVVNLGIQYIPTFRG
jgi:hypothetical protein